VSTEVDGAAYLRLCRISTANVSAIGCVPWSRSRSAR